MLFAFGLVAVALLHGMAAAVAVSEAFFFAPATGAGRADAGSRNTQGRILFHWVDGGVLAGLGIFQRVQHCAVDFVLVQRGELRAVGQECLRSQLLICCSGQLKSMRHDAAFFPNAAVPAPEPSTVTGINRLVGKFGTDGVVRHTRPSISFSRSSISACRSLLMGTRLLFFHP